MNENSKRAFLNMMELICDYPKFVMMEMFLSGSALTAKSFLLDSAKLPSRAVYDNLRKWREEGIICTEGRAGYGGSYDYRLNAKYLLEKLS